MKNIRSAIEHSPGQTESGSSGNSPQHRYEVISGCLLGMAVADALGVPREGLSPRRARAIFGNDDLNHRLFFGMGMISDDTEHACMTAQALLKSGMDTDRFRKSLGWRLRWWLSGIPAGVGLGTLRAILKLWIGFPPTLSGVKSAGNGPAMRAPIIGALLTSQDRVLRQTVQASTRITHTDRRAEEGAMVIAAAADYAAAHTGQPLCPGKVLNALRQHATEQELLDSLDCVEHHLEQGSTPDMLADEMGLTQGVTGYINNTVPIALFCWLRYPGDFRQSVVQAIHLGGDADTVGAITGALAGITAGQSAIPPEWIDGLRDWPRSVSWMDALSERLSRQFPASGDGETAGPQAFFWPGQVLRNLMFAAIVICHGFRRLFPPYSR